MQEDRFFTEVQRFKQWWIWLLIGGLNCFFIFMAYQQVVMKVVMGDRPMSNIGLLCAVAVLLIFTVFFFRLKLTTHIDPVGVYVKFSLFQRRFHRYCWEEIERPYVRAYKPLAEYGGWGIRYGFNGKAYNVSGNQGLQLELKDGKKVLIGTSKPAEVEKALRRYFYK